MSVEFPMFRAKGHFPPDQKTRTQ